MGYGNWRNRLAGKTVTTHPDPTIEDEGYYRKPLTKKGVDARGNPNGKTIVTGFRPVALYVVDGVLVGSIDGGANPKKDLTHEQVCELWTWICRCAITYEMYQAVAEKGEAWPDQPAVTVQAGETIPAGTLKAGDAVVFEGDTIPAANRDVARGDNNPPEDLPLDRRHAEAVDAAIGAAADYGKPESIKSAEDVARAEGAKNRVAELRLAADKAGKAIYEPIYRTYKEEQQKWAPIVARAVETEGKIQKVVLTFKESERKRLLREEAERKAREAAAAEEQQRAADRAISAGEAEPAPPPVEPVPAAPAAKPAPAPTYGTRQTRAKVKKHVEVVDQDALYQHLREHDDVKALLIKLAQKIVDVGGTTPPGITVREGLI